MREIKWYWELFSDGTKNIGLVVKLGRIFFMRYYIFMYVTFDSF